MYRTEKSGRAVRFQKKGAADFTDPTPEAWAECRSAMARSRRYFPCDDAPPSAESAPDEALTRVA